MIDRVTLSARDASMRAGLRLLTGYRRAIAKLSTSRFVRGAALLAAMVLGGTPVHGATKTWANPVTGSWTAAGNWTGGVPTATDSAQFNTAGTYTVNFSSVFQQLNDMFFFSTGATVTFERLTSPATLQIINPSGGQNLTISGPTLNLGQSLPVNITVGHDTIINTFGILNVRVGSLLNTQGLLISSQGFNVLSNADVDSTSGSIGDAASSSASASVSGVGSTWTDTGQLIVGGRDGEGTLTIFAGGAVSNTVGYIGDNRTSSGAVLVSDVGSTWTNSDVLNVGLEGPGNLEIVSGGTVSNTTGDIAGNFPGIVGSVTVDGAGSTWHNSSELHVGSVGNATLLISNGGAVSNDSFAIVGRDGGQGAVTVTGAGSTWNIGSSLYLGANDSFAVGAATVTILPGGAVNVAADTVLHPAARLELEGGTLVTATLDDQGGVMVWTSGTLHLTGAGGLSIVPDGLFASLSLNQNTTLHVDHALTINAGAKLFAGGSLMTGSTTVAAGGKLFVGGAMPDFGAGLVNNGDVVFTDPTTVHGPVTNAAGGAITALENVTFSNLVNGSGGFFGAGTMTFNGGISPGASPAAVTIESDVAFGNTNTLFIEIGGATPGSQYDRLTIGGSASIAGNLNVSLINGFTPTGGQQFTILTASSIVNNGFVLTGPAANLFTLLVSGTNVILQTIGLPGDYNHNGVVDAADYVTWRRGFGTTYTQSDYDVWRAHFGQTAGTGSGANAAVPEPSTLALLIVCILAMNSGGRVEVS
jgi:T5SS/PEP-CTERM-associated repeat protein